MENRGYGRVYTYRKEDGMGYGVYDPEKVFFILDPEGKVYINDRRCTIIKKGDLPPCEAMTLRFKFSDPTYDPVVAGVGTGGTWKQVTFSPNIWDWTNTNAGWQNSFANAYKSISNYVDVIDGSLTGVNHCGSLFSGCNCLTSFEPTSTKDVIQAYSMFSGCTRLKKINSLNFEKVENAANMFHDCSSLKFIPNIIPVKVKYCGSMFQNCANVERGAIDIYNKLISQANPPTSYANCFLNCGSNTETGSAELCKIPESWGGLAPTIGGVTYPVVKIGSKYWIVDNLKYQTTNSDSFQNYPEFGQYYPKSDLSSVTSALPTGWRITTQSDYNTLFGDYSSDYVHSLQSTGYAGFPRATNSTGLSIVPSRRSGVADFTIAYLWTTTDEVLAQVNADSATFTNVVNPAYKYCIRLVKDA